MQELPSPAEWDWQQSPEDWSPKWTTLAEASKACSELISRGCKRACRGLCKCTEANLPCTALCSCAGIVTKNRRTFKSVSLTIHCKRQLS